MVAWTVLGALVTEPPPVKVVIAGMGSFMALLFLLGRYQNSRTRAVFRELAKHLGGKFEAAQDWTGDPRVLLRQTVGELPLVMRIGYGSPPGLRPGSKALRTSGWIVWPKGIGKVARLSVYPESPLGGIGKFLGMQDIRLGDPLLDPLCIVKCSLTEHETRGLLGPATRQALQSLAGRGDTFELCANAAGLFMVVPGHLSAEIEFRLLADALWELAERLRPRQESGPGVTMSTVDDVELPGFCRVCGEHLAGDLVRCRTCERPHHRDCWVYAGRCSTFGCAGEQELRRH